MRINGFKLAPLGEELRRAGEMRVQNRGRELVPQTVEQLQLALEELSIYEAELEIQNEELVASRCTIEESRKRYFHHFDLAPVALIRLDCRGLILETNILGAQILGVDRAQLHAIRRTMIAHIAPAAMETFQQHLEDALVSGGMETCEVSLRSSLGREMTVKIQTVKIRNENGTSDFYVSITDLTEQREIEEELVKQKAITQTARLAAESDRLARE